MNGLVIVVLVVAAGFLTMLAMNSGVTPSDLLSRYIPIGLIALGIIVGGIVILRMFIFATQKGKVIADEEGVEKFVPDDPYKHNQLPKMILRGVAVLAVIFVISFGLRVLF